MIEVAGNMALGLNNSGPGWALYKRKKVKDSFRWEPFKWYARPEQALDSVAERLISDVEGGKPSDIVKSVELAAQQIRAVRRALSEGAENG